MVERSYHHGDLRTAALAAAVEMIDEAGPASISLRDIARRIGVSHAAPAHHFKDKRGLLTALAVEGFTLLADALDEAEPASDLFEAGVAYVGFAVNHRAHFDVMFRPDLYRDDDPALTVVRARAYDALTRGIADLPESRRGVDPVLAGVAAWSFVHGFATLWLNQMVPAGLGEAPEDIARAASRFLFSA